jgi:hypothetical protein
MRIDGKGRQSEKQELSIVGSLICAALTSGTSNVNVVIAEPRNQDRITFRIEKGTQSKVSEDPAKQDSPNVFKRDPGSNLSDSIVAFSKEARPIVVTDQGKQIDFNELPEKHDSSITRNREPVSNRIASISILENNDRGRTSTELGIRIEGSC